MNDIVTNEDAYNAIVKRISELYKEVDRNQNIISIHRKHITYAKRRLRVLERGIKLMGKGHFVKAYKIFEEELIKT